MSLQPFDLSTQFVHLGRGATAVPQPSFNGMPWYTGYASRHADDGDEGRLVALHTFTESWGSWEMHPRGAELVAVVAGAMTLVQELDGVAVSARVEAGQAIVNPPGVWHTADVVPGESATVLFITAGAGTEHRGR